MKILYFGSDYFGIPSLEKILEKHEIKGIVTSPDKPAGRGMKICPNTVKKWAVNNNLWVYQPEKLDKPFIELLKTLEIDVLILISYGKKIPREIIEIPSKGATNVHPSLLPKYRGAAPIEWALINGEKETGVTIIKMSNRIDEGDILSVRKITIEDKDDIFTMKKKLSFLSAEMVVEVLDSIEKNRLKSTPQTGISSYARKLSKKDGLIDWNLSSERINNLIKGVKEWPGAYTFIQTAGGSKKYLKIFSAEKAYGDTADKKPGEIINLTEDAIEVACGTGSLLIYEVQVEGKKKNRASEFIRGYRIKTGTIFSNSCNSNG